MGSTQNAPQCSKTIALPGSNASTLNPKVLPLGVDPVCAAYVSTREVLQPLVGVKPSPTLPYLSEPRPHLLYRSIDGDRPCGLAARLTYKLVTRQRLLYFLIGCTPPQVPGSNQEHIRPGECGPEDSKCLQQSSEPFPTPEHPAAHHGQGAHRSEDVKHQGGAEHDSHAPHVRHHRQQWGPLA